MRLKILQFQRLRRSENKKRRHKHMNSSSHCFPRCKARLAQFQGPMRLIHPALWPMWTLCRRRALARQAIRPMQFMRPTLAPFAAFWMLASLLSIASAQTPNVPAHTLELSRPAKPWEFLPVVGTRAALFGNEAGRMEAWVYPLKFLREFHLIFHEGDRIISQES